MILKWSPVTENIKNNNFVRWKSTLETIPELSTLLSNSSEELEKQVREHTKITIQQLELHTQAIIEKIQASKAFYEHKMRNDYVEVNRYIEEFEEIQQLLNNKKRKYRDTVQLLQKKPKMIQQLIRLQKHTPHLYYIQPSSVITTRVNTDTPFIEAELDMNLNGTMVVKPFQMPVGYFRFSFSHKSTPTKNLCVDYYHRNELLACDFDNNVIQAFDFNTGVLNRIIPFYDNQRPFCVQYDNQNDIVFVVSWYSANYIHALDAKSGLYLYSFCTSISADLEQGHITSLIFDQRKREFIVIDGMNNMIKIFSPRGVLLRFFRSDIHSGIHHITLDEVNQVLYIIDNPSLCIRVLECENGACVRQIPLHIPLQGMCVSSDGTHLLGINNEKSEILIFNITTGQCERTIRHTFQSLSSIILIHNRIYACHSDCNEIVVYV
jgi:hypothetical protein